MPLDPTRFIDPDGPLSPEMFGDEGDEALLRRVKKYVAQAGEATTSLEATSPALEPAQRAYVLYLAYRRLVALNTSRPANQSQPEYSRQMLAQQIEDLRLERDRYKAEYEGWLARGGSKGQAGFGSSGMVRV